MKPPFDLTLSAMFKRIAYDASEQAIGDQVQASHRQDVLEEEYSEQLANNLLKYYENELRHKVELYELPLLHERRLWVKGQELHDEIKQIKAIIEILKTNKHDNRTHPLEKTEKP